MSSRVKTSAMARAISSAKCAATGRRSSRSSGWAPIASPSAVRGRAAASRRSRSPALGSGSYPTRAGAPRDTRCPRWPARSATCADRCETAHSPAREVAMPNTVVVTREEAIAVVQLNRPDVLNALNEELMKELVAVLSALDDDDAIRCIVLTGNERAFAAGADIKETFIAATPVTMLKQDLTANWEAIRRVRTPIIAAVSGYALGGGCELAMACDIIVASETAQFGQPEVNLGIMPGAGGTQRLTRAVGKYRAMEIILTGRFVKADEALAAGLVARVVPEGEWLDEAKRVAQEIASKAPIATRLAKEGVDRAYEGPLQLGLEYERRLLYLAFASEDTKEGLNAFLEKRKPDFKGK